MSETLTTSKIKLQIGLNKRMYDTGKISYTMYSRANEILQGRLTDSEKAEEEPSGEFISPIGLTASEKSDYNPSSPLTPLLSCKT